MKAKLSGLVCAVAILLLFFGAFPAKAEFVTQPISGPVFPPGSGPNVLEFSFPEEPDTLHNKVLTFEGSIQNASLTNGASILFWFDWVNHGTPFASGPQEFTLGPVGSGHNAQFFSGSTALTYTIPYCPEEVSVHFVNDTPGSYPPGTPPVFVSGTFTYSCVPEPVALLILPVMVLIAPWAVRRVQALASSV